MIDYSVFKQLSPTVFADVLSRDQVMDPYIRSLWQGTQRVAGPAYPVRCPRGDMLMLHVAIYRASPGSIIVVESGEMNYALAGGNVCAIAQKRAIAGLVVDGLMRDIAEIRASGFPVFARGLIPIAARRGAIGALNEPIRCGGVCVSPADVIVADEEGIVVVPSAELHSTLAAARMRVEKEAAESLETWEEHHRWQTDDLLRSLR